MTDARDAGDRTGSGADQASGEGYPRRAGGLPRALSGWALAGGLRAHWIAVWALAALVTAVYAVLALTFYYTFNTASYDLVIFDQAVRSYAHFQPGISIMKGTDAGLGPHFSVLGDHWSPILALLAPLYWIYDGPQTLLVAQAVLFALAIPPLWLFTHRAFGGGHRWLGRGPRDARRPLPRNTGEGAMTRGGSGI